MFGAGRTEQRPGGRAPQGMDCVGSWSIAGDVGVICSARYCAGGDAAAQRPYRGTGRRIMKLSLGD